MPGYLYILQSDKNGRYYVGSCVDPDRRLAQHNANANRATKNRGPWRRVALVPFLTPAEAKKAEAFLKRQKSRRILEMVVSQTFEWPCEFDR